LASDPLVGQIERERFVVAVEQLLRMTSKMRIKWRITWNENDPSLASCSGYATRTLPQAHHRVRQSQAYNHVEAADIDA